jgi:hypothetical protein
MHRPGKWSKEEEDQLMQVYDEVSAEPGTGDGIWTAVSHSMGGKRNKQQCAEKWFVTPDVWSKFYINA